MPRKIKAIDHWRRLLKSGTLTPAGQVKAAEAIERLEKAEGRGRAQPEPEAAAGAKDDRLPRRVVTNPGCYTAHEECRREGFTGNYSEWSAYLGSIPSDLPGGGRSVWWGRIDWRKAGDRRVFEPRDLLPQYRTNGRLRFYCPPAGKEWE